MKTTMPVLEKCNFPYTPTAKTDSLSNSAPSIKISKTFYLQIHDKFAKCQFIILEPIKHMMSGNISRVSNWLEVRTYIHLWTWMEGRFAPRNINIMRCNHLQFPVVISNSSRQN